ncbi:hypothetical protein A2U01_0041716, partial [Trifolium medium]|nr:hypothetical protein [Trifolium medium]
IKPSLKAMKCEKTRFQHPRSLSRPCHPDHGCATLITAVPGHAEARKSRPEARHGRSFLVTVVTDPAARTL